MSKIQRQNLLRKIFWFLGAYSFLLIATVLGIIYYVGNNLNKINRSLLEIDELILEIEDIDNYFAEQAKDRKNLFLRGHNPQDLEKYLQEIEEMTEAIHESTNNILDDPLTQLYRDDLEAFLEGHTQLMQSYHQGVEIFKETQDHRAGDQFVRGKGKDVNKTLDQVMEQLKIYRQKKFLNNQKNIQFLLSISVIAVVVLLLAYSAILSAVIARPIRRIVHFTSFLEANHEAYLYKDFDDHDLQNNISQPEFNEQPIYHPLLKSGEDEVSYMIDAHQKLASLINGYAKQLSVQNIQLLHLNQSLKQTYQELQENYQQLQQAQLQIVQSEKMSVLGNLVAGIGHEINNPVGFLGSNLQPAQAYIQDLLGLIDVYQAEYPQANDNVDNEIEVIDLAFVREDLPRLIHSMHNGISRIYDISNSLRTFSRQDRDHKTVFNVHDGLDSTLLLLKHRTQANEKRPSIQIVCNYGDLPEVMCFPGQLNQVFMNILANAIDACDEINKDKTFTEIEANPNVITIQTACTNTEVTIQIKDNGCGIKPEIVTRIFEQGFTTKEVGKGTGLGMAIARQIIEETHGGRISCISEQGKGSRFKIELPLEG